MFGSRKPVATTAPLWRAVGVLALLFAAREAAALLAPLAVAGVLFLLLGAHVERLQQRGLSGGSAAAIVVFGPALLLAGGALWGAPSAMAWWAQLRAGTAQIARELQASLGAAPALGRPATAVLEALQDHAAMSRPWNTGEWVAAVLTGVSVAMLTFFLLLAQRPLLSSVLRVLPGVRARVRFLAACRESRVAIAAYLGVMGLVNLGLGVVCGAVFWAIGLGGTLAWVAVVTLLLFIPYLGPLLLVMMLAVAGQALAGAWWWTLSPAAAFLGLHVIEANFISPWLMGRRLAIGRPALLIAVMAGAWAWGIVGAVLAVPALLVARSFLRRQHRASLWTALLAGDVDRAPSIAQSSKRALD